MTVLLSQMIQVRLAHKKDESRNIVMERESGRGSVFESSLKLYLEYSACFCC